MKRLGARVGERESWAVSDGDRKRLLIVVVAAPEPGRLLAQSMARRRWRRLQPTERRAVARARTHVERGGVGTRSQRASKQANEIEAESRIASEEGEAWPAWPAWPPLESYKRQSEEGNESEREGESYCVALATVFC